MKHRLLITVVILGALVMVPAFANAWVVIVKASYPITEGVQEKFLEAAKKYPPPVEGTKTVGHGPYFYPDDGKMGWIEIWEVDDSELLDGLDRLVNAYGILSAEIPGFKYDVKLAADNKDFARVGGKFPPQ